MPVRVKPFQFMHAVKVMTLCSFFAFGAYTEYNAGVITGQKTTAAYSGVMPSKSSGPDNGFMHRAIELSHGLSKNEAGHPSGSVVVKDGIIVGEGFDKVTMTDDPSAHA